MSIGESRTSSDSVTDDLAGFCQGRLTLTSGTAVTTSDVTAATTIYFTPYKGDRVTLYTGSQWNLYEFTEKSLSVPSTTTTMYDVFGYDSSGDLALEAVAWTNDTTRATALTKQNGVYVKSGDTGKRYLGSFRTTGVSGECEDSEGVRFLWNYYNRVERTIRYAVGDSHTYNTNTIRYYNNDSTNKIEFIRGVSEEPIYVKFESIVDNNSGAASWFAALDLDGGTTEEVTVNMRDYISVANVLTQGWGIYNKQPSEGYHFLGLVENGTGAGGTTTWYEYVATGHLMG